MLKYYEYQLTKRRLEGGLEGFMVSSWFLKIMKLLEYRIAKKCHDFHHCRRWLRHPYSRGCQVRFYFNETEQSLKGQCPDYAHARVSSVFSSKDNRTVKLTRQDFLPDRTADRDLLFIFSSNILDFQRSLSSYIKIWLAVRRLKRFYR